MKTHALARQPFSTRHLHRKNPPVHHPLLPFKRRDPAFFKKWRHILLTLTHYTTLFINFQFLRSRSMVHHHSILRFNPVLPDSRFYRIHTITGVCMASTHQPRTAGPTTLSFFPEPLSSPSYYVQLRQKPFLCTHGATASLRYPRPPLSGTPTGTYATIIVR